MKVGRRSARGSRERRARPDVKGRETTIVYIIVYVIILCHIICFQYIILIPAREPRPFGRETTVRVSPAICRRRLRMLVPCWCQRERGRQNALICTLTVFKSSVWRNGPSPWEMWTFEGHVEVKISNGSGICDPQCVFLRIEIMRTDLRCPKLLQRSTHMTGAWQTPFDGRGGKTRVQTGRK